MAEAWKVWERTIAQHAQACGLPWERRLRLGDNHDLLDLDGCLPDGWLVGAKSIRRGKTFGIQVNEGMAQCDRALVNLARPYVSNGHGHWIVDSGGIIPVQVIQRSGYPTGKAYVVLQYDYFLDLAVMRREWSQQ